MPLSKQFLPYLTALLAITLPVSSLRAEAMLQYFNTDWAEITAKIPELAEAGYSSLWLPPPTKGSGGLSVGYDLWDRFDLGSKNQRGTVRTRYGSEGELLRLIETAHRFGIRIYFDNIMNHNAFDVPGFNSDTPIDVYPGMVAEDFHLRVTEDGFYRKWDNTRDWNSAWQVQNLGLADLIDIAHETPNTNFGASEGDDHPKITFIRQPNNPEYYLDTNRPITVSNSGGSFQVFTFANKEPFQDMGYGGGTGAGNGRFDWNDTNANGQHDAGETSEPFTDLGLYPTDSSKSTNPAFGGGDGIYNMGNPVPEDVNAFLIRAARWQLDRTNADGYRLDAVKHVPDYFFGKQFGADKDKSSDGYLGKSQEQFNLTRGFSDWDNHRDALFNTEQGRDDAMMFGEHLGEPPGYGGYVDAGMRLVDNPLRNEFNSRLGNPSSGLNGYDQPGWGGFSPAATVMHAQSHDNDYAARRELQHAMYFTRAGLGLLYTDGNHQAETLGESGGAFPRHANTSFLGQWNDRRIPNLLSIHEQFARGYQVGRWSDSDVVIYERIDKRENGGMSDTDGVTLLFMVNDNYASGQGRNFNTSFNHTPGGTDDYLYNYSAYGGGFYKYASSIVNGSTLVPPGGYFAFSFKNPDPSELWAGDPVEIYQNGSKPGSVMVTRTDGPDGDPGYNPYALPDSNPTDYSYDIEVPRVTDLSSLQFVARVDGSARDVLFKLDAGMNLNAINHGGGDSRDHPPGLSTDSFLGYEAADFVQRIYPEMFAAAVTSTRNTTGSLGAETYTTSGVLNTGANDKLVDADTTIFVYHDPSVPVGGIGSPPNMWDNANRHVWVKTNAGLGGFQAFLYYSDNSTFPEGAGGQAIPGTTAVEMTFQHDQGGGSPGSWWRTTNPVPVSFDGSSRYKIGVFKNGDVDDDVFPSGSGAVNKKLKMMATWETSEINGTTIQHRPHADYGKIATGLAEGFHIISARAFLQRDNQASIYSTLKQTFYIDAQRPGAELLFPAQSSTVGGSEYGAVVRGDESVKEVWFRISDIDANNDDGITETDNGNGAWVQAEEVTPTPAVASTFAREWRFNYVNIPSSGNATIEVVAREVSSSAIGDISSGAGFDLNETAGHYTLISRNVTTAGPVLKMFVAFPQTNGEVVDDSYVMKVYFSKTLANGFDLNNASQLQNFIDRFLISIGSNEPGAVGVGQDRADYSIVQNETADFHALAFPLPNLYNDVPDYLHKITVTHDRPDPNADLSASRTVRAAPSTVPFVSITTPPELDSDGRPYEIVLPDVASPTAADRQFLVRVATSSTVTSVNIVFETGSGVMTPGASNPIVEGNTKFWDFAWTGMTEGQFRFRADVDTGNGGDPENSDARNATVLFRQMVASAATDPDTDDDGLSDTAEGQLTPLPNGWPTTHPSYKANPESWTNGDVHIHNAYGRTDPFSPDSDGDLLPDSLEVGWRNITIPGEPFADTGYDHDGEVGTPLLGVGNRQFDWRDDNGNGVHEVGEPREPFTDGDADNTYDFGTIAGSDTDGDGFPNFIGDLDPPFYNTLDNLNKVPGVNSASEGGDRAKQLRGSTTDPNNPDTDGDGLFDGIEDANRNGWIDGEPWTDTNGNGKYNSGEPFTDLNGDSVYNTGDGEYLPTSYAPYLGRVWPNGVMDPGERWSETSSTNPDTDGDGANDGYGEDKNLNGLVNGDTDGDRIYDSGEQWTETDPLKADTDGDGLPDGWETAYGLDPLDNGTDNLRTAMAGDGAPNQRNGATGDPDVDTFSNAQELANGTSPTTPDTGVAPPANSITIGPVSTVQVGTVINRNEFTDWQIEDLLVLDEYDGGGTNNQGSDVYHANDGFDSSRDLVAFYAHDGGPTNLDGDGMFHFRVDLQDLRAYAEEGNLDIYVVIDTGNVASGEYALPDDIDTGTNMRWEAVVALYSSNNGRVYVDTNNTSNSTAIGQALSGFGVVARNQNTPNGFGRAHYSSDLDAVEFSISRQALLDAGWNGLDAADLNYQVFTTRDGTNNTPTPGAGDIGGRSDIRDSIYDDNIASDYWRDQGPLGGSGSVLKGWFGVNAGNDRGKRAKVITLIHEAKAILAGSEILPLINTGAGAGYYRPLDAHEAYGVPATMHIPPTLGSSIQWASARPGSDAAAFANGDGPAFNERIGDLFDAGIVELVGSTFSDHILPYFSDSYNADNVALAEEFLGDIYGKLPSGTVFYTPERVLDSNVLDKVANLGFGYTFVDQMRHIQKWFGRTAALSDDGYRINEIRGVKTFVINESAADFRFTNTDNGLPATQRQLLNRKARSGQQAQVVTIFSDWSDFTNPAKADAYDRNIRWLASRPWIEIVTPDQIANGEIDISTPPDGFGDVWSVVNRGTPSLVKVAKDWVDHATQENYDNWYVGSAIEESLQFRQFNIRSGVPVFNDTNGNGVKDGIETAKTFGMVANGTGIVNEAWTAVAAMGDLGSGIGKLARGTAHASVYLTAFHQQSNNDLNKFSTGAYINPDGGPLQNLQGFAVAGHSQARFSAVYSRVEEWELTASSTTQAVAEDIDLDGEKEYLIYNSQIFALFEAQGGRMTGGWVRNPRTGKVYQVVGNFLSRPEGETEAEGTANASGGAVAARRTSAFKDQYAVQGATTGYVNDLFVATQVPGGWQFVSSDGVVTKTITLGNSASKIVAAYELGGDETGLFVRFGLSPNLYSLLLQGQSMLAGPTLAGNEVHVTNSGGDDTINAFVEFAGGASYNSTAIDTAIGTFEPDTVNMRNQAQTQQVEIQGDTAFTIALGFESNGTDSDNDTLPDWWERANGLDPEDNGTINIDNGPNGDPDGDTVDNATEFLVGLKPQIADIQKYPRADIGKNADGSFTVTFPVLANRIYRVRYSDSVGAWTQAGADIPITSDNPAFQWVDDGSSTDPDPSTADRRFYDVQISLP